MRLSQLIYVLICIIVVLIIIANIILEIYFFANFCKFDYSIDNSFNPDKSILQIGVDVIQLGPTDPMEMTQDICVNESNREIFEENFELARLRAEELGVNIQLLKGF